MPKLGIWGVFCGCYFPVLSYQLTALKYVHRTSGLPGSWLSQKKVTFPLLHILKLWDVLYLVQKGSALWKDCDFEVEQIPV